MNLKVKPNQNQAESEPKPYQTPQIIYEGQVTTQAGLPLAACRRKNFWTLISQINADFLMF